MNRCSDTDRHRIDAFRFDCHYQANVAAMSPAVTRSRAALTRLTTALTKAAKLPAFEDRGARAGERRHREQTCSAVVSTPRSHRLWRSRSTSAIRFRLVVCRRGDRAPPPRRARHAGCLAIAGYDLSLNVTAALLTIIGYSVNDTIVIFDRVRENAKTMRGESLAAVVDVSVNQTLSRTVITAGMTLLSVLALYLFGGEALRGFAFTMLVGIVSGTYSTVFIASAIATRLSQTPHLVSNRVPHGSLRIP